jgi:hypothetical protein
MGNVRISDNKRMLFPTTIDFVAKNGGFTNEICDLIHPNWILNNQIYVDAGRVLVRSPTQSADPVKQ